MDELIYTIMYLINFGLCALAFAITRAALSAGSDIKVSLNRFAAVTVVVSVLTGFPLLYGLLWLFERAGQQVNFGHGEGLIAAPLLNFAIGLLLAGLGRILLRWQAIRW
jgi:hypothetical protein